MCLFSHCHFVCRLIGEVDCDGGGSVCIFFVQVTLCTD